MLSILAAVDRYSHVAMYSLKVIVLIPHIYVNCTQVWITPDTVGGIDATSAYRRDHEQLSYLSIYFSISFTIISVDRG